MDFMKIIGAVAPTLATAVGGPVGGMAAKFITDALGISNDASKDDISKAINGATPDQIGRAHV